MVHVILQFRHTVEGGVAGNVMVELPQTGSATTFYGEEPGTQTGQPAHITPLFLKSVVHTHCPSLPQMKTVEVMRRC